MQALYDFIAGTLNTVAWIYILLPCVFVGGLYYTIGSGGVQFRRFGYAMTKCRLRASCSRLDCTYALVILWKRARSKQWEHSKIAGRKIHRKSVHRNRGVRLRKIFFKKRHQIFSYLYVVLGKDMRKPPVNGLTVYSKM